MRFSYFTLLLTGIISFGSARAIAQDKITAQDMPQQWLYSSGFDQTQPTYDNWWLGFQDPMLDSLINIAVSNNFDVLTAKHRIEMARQTLRQTQSQYYPTVGVSGSWNRQQSSGATAVPITDAHTASYFDIGATMSWQIDIFGKITAQTKDGKAKYRASRTQYDAMVLTVSAKIATAYLQLRTLQGELDVLNEHIAQQKRVADITKARHDAGLASMLDVTQALTTYYSTQASITSVNTSIVSTINGLAVLLGVYPQDLTPYLTTHAPLPDYKQMVAVGIPMDLLRRRPDIAEAEETLASYAAALGVAKKDFLPDLTLQGSIGTMAHDGSDLFGKQSFTYSVMPTLSWTIFDGFNRQASVAAAREQLQAGIDTYNSTVLTAVQEADNAMATYYNDQKYIEMITQVVEQAKKSFDLSIDLYKQGLTDFINVTNAQISYLQYSNELVSAKGAALAALVNLYEALGGGWAQVSQTPLD